MDLLVPNQVNIHANSFKGADAREVCAIEVMEQKISFSHIRYAYDGAMDSDKNTPSPTLIAYGAISHNGIEQLQGALAAIIDKHNLKDIVCSWVLAPSQYRLLLVDTPEVPPEEYKEALRWQLKDIIDFPLEDVTLDIFAPGGAKLEETKKLYAVIAQTSFLRKISGLLNQHFLKLSAIDIREFALRNLIVTTIKDDRPIGYVFLNETCNFLVVTGGKIYFTRDIPLDKSKMNDITAATQYITMELHRSVDYFETEFGQSIPLKFFVASVAAINSEALKSIVTNFVGEVEVFNLAKAISISDSLKEIIAQPMFYPVVGAALRQS